MNKIKKECSDGCCMLAVPDAATATATAKETPKTAAEKKNKRLNQGNMA